MTYTYPIICHSNPILYEWTKLFLANSYPIISVIITSYLASYPAHQIQQRKKDIILFKL